MRIVLFLLMALTSWTTYAEACQPLRDPILDVKGNALVGVSVAISLTQTGVAATLYSDSACSVVTTNPATTGTDGTYNVFIEDGVYTVTPVKAGYSFVTVTNINVFDPVLQHNIPVQKYATLDITAPSTGAIDQIGSAVKTLVINVAATATTTKTCPSTLTIRFEGQGTLTLSAGQTLTVNCRILNQTDHAIFLGTGTYAKTADGLGHRLESVTNAQLGSSAANGTVVYCTDCTLNSATCAAASTGARATRINGAWRCD